MSVHMWVVTLVRVYGLPRRKIKKTIRKDYGVKDIKLCIVRSLNTLLLHKIFKVNI